MGCDVQGIGVSLILEQRGVKTFIQILEEGIREKAFSVKNAKIACFWILGVENKIRCLSQERRARAFSLTRETQIRS